MDIHYLASGAFESVADLPAFEEATFVAIGIALGVPAACDLAHVARVRGYGSCGVGLATNAPGHGGESAVGTYAGGVLFENATFSIGW